MYRWSNWKITGESDRFEKLDSGTVAFDATIGPEETKTIRYTVTYTW